MLAQSIKQHDNILFLDFDGVINGYVRDRYTYCITVPIPSGGKLYYASISCMKYFINLIELCKKYNYKVVVSSSWRVGNLVEDFNTAFNQMLQVLEKEDELFIGKTAYCYDIKTRGEEIKNYIETFKVKNYIIIDDEYFDFDKYFNLKKDFIKTDGAFGLRKQNINRLRYIMKYKSKNI